MRHQLDFSRPGKLTDNAKLESFNGRLRQECLNVPWFLSLEDAGLMSPLLSIKYVIDNHTIEKSRKLLLAFTLDNLFYHG